MYTSICLTAATRRVGLSPSCQLPRMTHRGVTFSGGSSRSATRGFSAPPFISDWTSGPGDRFSICASRTSSFLPTRTLRHCRDCWHPILPTSLSSPPSSRNHTPLNAIPTFPFFVNIYPSPPPFPIPSHSFFNFISILGLQPKTEKRA
jgi:hypothetical protein